MYAGIGYFALPYLVHARAAHLHACEWDEVERSGVRVRVRVRVWVRVRVRARHLHACKWDEDALAALTA